MPSIAQVREAVRRRTRDDGVLVETRMPTSIPLEGTLGEVLSLTPPRCELLSGYAIRPKAFIGPTPQVGDLVLLVSIGQWWLAFTGMTVV